MRIPMRVLLDRVSFLSVCFLALSAAPARGQSPTLASVPPNLPVAKSVDDPTKAVDKAGSTPSLEEMRATIKRLEMRVKELEDKADKGATDPTTLSVTASKAVKEDAVNAVKEDAAKEETVQPVATAKPTALPQGLSWTKGDFKITLYGAVRLDAYYESGRTQGPGMPAFLVPKFVGGFPQQNIALNARHSMVGLLFSGPDIGKFHSGGKIQAVFIDNTNVFADRNGFMLTQAYGELFNDKWRLAAGLQLDVFAPGLPTLLPFTIDGAPVGNYIKGQLRAERYLKLGSNSQLTVQGALSEPLSSFKTPDISLDEDVGLPNGELRMAFGLGKPSQIGLLRERPVEIGISGVIGRLRRTSLPSETPRRVISTTWGVNLDFRANLGDRFGFKGEVYTGKGLGQMGGTIAQTLDAVTWNAIGATGGWVEGYVYLRRDLHNHTGIFIDDPVNKDITGIPNTFFGRTRNRGVYNTLLWDIGMEKKRFRVGLELMFRKTEYKDPVTTGRFPASGFGIHPQFQWLF